MEVDVRMEEMRTQNKSELIDVAAATNPASAGKCPS